jgi:RNase P subunit RPR2
MLAPYDGILEKTLILTAELLEGMAKPLVCEQCHKPFENMRGEKAVVTIAHLTMVCSECGHTTVLNGEYTSD